MSVDLGIDLGTASVLAVSYTHLAILEERKTYEKNRRRRPKEFRDWNYICCSTYGNPRSKGFHQKYYKDLLKSLDLPDIHFHQLRNTYATILLKNSFNSKGVSHLLGHAKEIISVDVTAQPGRRASAGRSRQSC